MDIQKLFDLPHRPFEMTEEADISCNLPQHTMLEEDHLYHMSGDKLHAVGDNLYRVSRYDSREVEFFESLAAALAEM